MKVKSEEYGWNSVCSPTIILSHIILVGRRSNRLICAMAPSNTNSSLVALKNTNTNSLMIILIKIKINE